MGYALAHALRWFLLHLYWLLALPAFNYVFIFMRWILRTAANELLKGLINRWLKPQNADSDITIKNQMGMSQYLPLVYIAVIAALGFGLGICICSCRPANSG